MGLSIDTLFHDIQLVCCCACFYWIFISLGKPLAYSKLKTHLKSKPSNSRKIVGPGLKIQIILPTEPPNPKRGNQ